MEASIAVGVLLEGIIQRIALATAHESVSLLIHVASSLVIFTLALLEVIVIHEVVARVVRRVDVNHLHLAEVRLLEEFEGFEVVALDIDVLGVVPIHTILWHRAQGLGDRLRRLTSSLLLTHPVKLVSFGCILHGIIAKQLAEHTEVNGMFDTSRLAILHFGDARRGNAS